MSKSLWKQWVALAVGVGASLASSVPVRANAPVAEAPESVNHLKRALQATSAMGQPLIVAVTSTAMPASRETWRRLLQTRDVRTMAREVQFIELIAERAPATVKQFAVTAPCLLAYRKGASGIELAGRLVNPRDEGAILDWLRALELPKVASAVPPTMSAADEPLSVGVDPKGEGVASEVDPNVKRAGFQPTQAEPSAQGYGPTTIPQEIPSPRPQPMMGMPQVQQQQPMIVGQPMLGAAPPQGPAVVVPTPSQTVFVQQQPPTVVVGSPGGANVMYAGNLGTPSFGTPVVAQPNLMMGTPGQPAAPQPMMGAAPQPTLGAGPAQLLPVANFGAGQPANQQVVGVIMERPNLLRRGLGALGRSLAPLGNPSIRLNQTEVPQLPLTTIPMGLGTGSGQAPIIIQQPPAGESPPVTRPSPQGNEKHHRFFGHD